MKKVIFTTYILSLLLITNSCSLFEDRKLSSEEGVKNIENIILESFKDKHVYYMTIFSKNELSNSLSHINVHYYEANESYSQMWSYMGELKKPNSTTTKFDKDEFGLAKISNLNITNISNQFNKAVTIIKEKYKGYDDFNLYNYSIIVKPDGVINKHLTINATGDATNTSLQGKNIVMNYQPFLFEVASNGDVELQEKQ